MGRDQMRLREDRVLASFCAALAICDGEAATVLSRPDRESNGQGGCEAIILRRGKEYAVEHTTIDSFPGQREDDARLRAVLDPATRAIAREFPDLRISLCVPIGAIATGCDWARLRADFVQHVVAAVRTLPAPNKNAVVSLPGHFDVMIFRRPSRQPGCFVSRMVHADDLEQRTHVIARALVEKRVQLLPYREAGDPTILLLDNDDIGLMEPYTAAEAFRRATSATSVIDFDEIYLVDSTESPPWFYPLKLGERLAPDLPEFEMYFRRQYELTFGPGQDS